MNIIELLSRACAVILILSLHEFAHAFVAYRCGDPTAKWEGRMTLNPLKHFDLAGMLMFVLIGFGWAKPVPVNPNNFKNYKRGLFFTAAAGVIFNLILAFLFYPLLVLATRYLTEQNLLFIFIKYFLQYFVIFNLNFCIFNLIPLYPLDGFRIWDALDRRWGKIYRFFRAYGYYILLALIVVHYLSGAVWFLTYIDILGRYMGFLIENIYRLITTFWGLII